MTERWLSCPNASRYLVSSTGVVRRENEVGLEGSLVAGVRNKRINHLSVRLVEDDGAVRHRAVHRLVCEAFNGPPLSAGAACVFLDRDKRNFDPQNLAWVDMSVANIATRNENGTRDASLLAGLAEQSD